jgi:hypothetical protein
MTTPLDPELAGPVAAEPSPVAGDAGPPVVDPGPVAADGSPVAGGPRKRKSRRRLVLVMLTVIGLVGVAGGGTLLARELTRSATLAEAAAAARQEVATRWQRLPAGKVFPAELTFRDLAGGDTVTTTARLVGIAPPVSCKAALEKVAERLVNAFGCATVLRATYVDAAGTAATTVGVLVLRSPYAAKQAHLALLGIAPDNGMHVVSYTGTVTGAFGDPGRGAFGTQVAGPYVFVYTAGFTDGISGTLAAADPNELTSLGAGVITVVKRVLTAHGRPCTMKDIKC